MYFLVQCYILPGKMCNTMQVSETVVGENSEEGRKALSPLRLVVWTLVCGVGDPGPSTLWLEGLEPSSPHGSAMFPNHQTVVSQARGLRAPSTPSVLEGRICWHMRPPFYR